MQKVVEKLIFFVPQTNTRFTDIGHRLCYGEEMVEKLDGDFLVNGVVQRKFQCDTHHVEWIHGHPSRAICLIQLPSSWDRLTPVKNTYIIKAQEPSLKNISIVRIFTIHPPSEI